MNGHVILTSGNRQIAENWHKIEVGAMSFSEGKQLLKSIIRQDRPDNNAEVETLAAALEDSSEFDQLLKDLGGLPLAIEQAASYMSKHHLTPRQYRVLFEREGKHQLDRFSSPRFDGKGRQSVMKTWLLAYEKIQDADALAAQLLLLLSLLHNEDIPFDLLKDALVRQQQWSEAGELEQETKRPPYVFTRSSIFGLVYASRTNPRNCKNNFVLAPLAWWDLPSRNRISYHRIFLVDMPASLSRTKDSVFGRGDGIQNWYRTLTYAFDTLSDTNREPEE
ncbi:hypothetical protein H2201_008663 [Coniosporium apollinis]|uniref:Uncharacterized protein n=1 Tax=Coniosporium apollinis TaxID=61459 RepID=A0ABQ9NKR4_9PEZI|nr:hypothetical protein H2201_008663 [Coniosporium apollinis]